MLKLNRRLRVISSIAFLSLSAQSLEAIACASCGCSLSTDWSSQGQDKSEGFSIDVRYDFLNQDELRHGTQSISVAQVNAMAPTAEVEDYTKNQYLTLTLGYQDKAHWSVNVSLPYIIRQHQTWGSSDDPTMPANSSNPLGYASDFNNLGDIKAVFNFYPDATHHNLGLTLGLKLPTGDHQVASNLPYGQGTLLDPGLQPGTGTTDLILGAYYFEPINRDWDHFEQFLFQRAVLGPTDNYRPGDGYNFNIGLRYMSFESVVPQIQINVRHVNTDSGAIADTQSTGGTLAYLSPGLSVKLAKDMRVYGFLQIPLYQNVTGFQLAPRYTASVGVNYVF